MEDAKAVVGEMAALVRAELAGLAARYTRDMEARHTLEEVTFAVACRAAQERDRIALKNALPMVTFAVGEVVCHEFTHPGCRLLRLSFSHLYPSGVCKMRKPKRSFRSKMPSRIPSMFQPERPTWKSNWKSVTPLLCD